MSNVISAIVKIHYISNGCELHYIRDNLSDVIISVYLILKIIGLITGWVKPMIKQLVFTASMLSTHP